MRKGFRDVEATTDDAINTIDKATDMSKDEVARYSMMAVKSIEGDARAMLVKNLRDSGVGTITPADKYESTGKLAEAVANAIISVRMKGGAPVIVASMPTGMPAYQNKGGTKSNFYEVAASQSFGAVITKKERRKVFDASTGKIKMEKQSVIGAKAKRTVKKTAFGEAASSRAVNAVEEGRRFKKFNELKKGGKVAKGARKSIKGFHIGNIASEKAGSIKMSGGATVIKPRPFFLFKPAQKEELTGKFINAFMNLTLEKFGRK